MAKPLPTHIAYTLKQETRTTWRWLEVGTAVIENDGKNGAHQIQLHLVPIGGWSGRCRLLPVGTKPPELETEPERPAEQHQSEPGSV